MGSRPFPEIPCIICNKPLDLSLDLTADENGKAVHEDCYVRRLAGDGAASLGAARAD
jgi:hypothetical protein